MVSDDASVTSAAPEAFRSSRSTSLADAIAIQRNPLGAGNCRRVRRGVPDKTIDPRTVRRQEDHDRVTAPA